MSQGQPPQQGRQVFRTAWSLWFLALWFAWTAGAAPRSGDDPVPVLYCTDLFHPHQDPDDHFDLATIYAMPGIELKGIILDQGARQLQQPGRVPVSQLNHLSGRTVPVAIGLATRLKSPADAALDQPSEFQGGVRFILDTLRAAPQPVAIATVGSVRDVVAAFNREPTLFRHKVATLVCFIGEASKVEFVEYNVELDPQAYIGLMRSGLPVYWVPCFDGGLWQNRGHASFWQAQHGDLLLGAVPGLLQYFIYALEKERSDPIAFLGRPVEPQRQARLFAAPRNLWCTAVFCLLGERRVVIDSGGDVRFERTVIPGADAARDFGPFAFEEVELSIDDQAVVHYGSGPGAQKVRRFRVNNPATYPRAMTAATAALLRQFPRPAPDTRP